MPHWYLYPSINLPRALICMLFCWFRNQYKINLFWIYPNMINLSFSQNERYLSDYQRGFIVWVISFSCSPFTLIRSLRFRDLCLLIFISVSAYHQGVRLGDITPFCGHTSSFLPGSIYKKTEDTRMSSVIPVATFKYVSTKRKRTVLREHTL